MDRKYIAEFRELSTCWAFESYQLWGVDFCRNQFPNQIRESQSFNLTESFMTKVEVFNLTCFQWMIYQPCPTTISSNSIILTNSRHYRKTTISVEIFQAPRFPRKTNRHFPVRRLPTFSLVIQLLGLLGMLANALCVNAKWDSVINLSWKAKCLRNKYSSLLVGQNARKKSRTISSLRKLMEWERERWNPSLISNAISPHNGDEEKNPEERSPSPTY